MSPAFLRQVAIFFGIFLVVNLAFDAYRAGGLTPGAFTSALTVSLFATAIYAAFIWFTKHRGKDGR
jgi:hypothetical protein